MKYIIVIICTIILLSCDNHNIGELHTSDHSTILEKYTEQTQFFPMVNPHEENPILIELFPEKEIEDLKEEDQQKLHKYMSENYAPVSMEIRKAIFSIEDIQESDSSLRDIIAEYSSEPYAYRLEQAAASDMLHYRLLNKDAVNETKQEYMERISYYTNLLLKNKNPDAHLIHQALEHLENYWSTESIIDAAIATKYHAEEYLDEHECLPCREEIEDMLEENPEMKDEITDAYQLKLYQIHSAKPKLMEMAANSD